MYINTIYMTIFLQLGISFVMYTDLLCRCSFCVKFYNYMIKKITVQCLVSSIDVLGLASTNFKLNLKGSY